MGSTSTRPRRPLPDGLVRRPVDGAALAWLTPVVRVPSRHNEAISAFTEAVSKGLAVAGHHIGEAPHPG
ncbi:hypothetical protein [Streptomyces sp. PKU-EA00015]|uniref:hypothetical protein n=1 Tax=Streptomyces sp. PKU-EA00015 TaxID=2748326 RepID=UPI00210B1247|nr:hypothetical protein [Streptomyces sp. PKU-EA00015]